MSATFTKISFSLFPYHGTQKDLWWSDILLWITSPCRAHTCLEIYPCIYHACLLFVARLLHVYGSGPWCGKVTMTKASYPPPPRVPPHMGHNYYLKKQISQIFISQEIWFPWNTGLPILNQIWRWNRYNLDQYLTYYYESVNICLEPHLIVWYIKHSEIPLYHIPELYNSDHYNFIPELYYSDHYDFIPELYYCDHYNYILELYYSDHYNFIPELYYSDHYNFIP